MKYDAILEGGGAKIPGLVGGLAGIESRGFTPSHLAGTSAGAIVAAGRIAGYTPEELQDILTELNMSEFKDGNGFGRKFWNITRAKGIYKGDYFYEFMKEMLGSKGVETFGDIVSSEPNEKNTPVWRWRFKCLAADITNERLVKWPNDAVLYNMRPDDVEVAWAVRTSMSLPYFFQPVKRGKIYFVDGGLLSNFPLDIWDSPTSPTHPTFGLLLDEADSQQPNKITATPFSFFNALFGTVLKAHDRRFIKPGDYEHRTIKIPTGSAKTTDFDMTAFQKQALHDSGYKAATKFLDHWSWPEYLQWTNHIRGVTNGNGTDS